MVGLCYTGVQREYRLDSLRDDKEQWIRAIEFLDEEHFCVICCTYAQAKAFQHAQCLEMDLAFKMVQGKTNLFSIEDWCEETKRELAKNIY